MLCAVEENWLNQAPKPHLDKVAALQAVDSDPDLENSERSTSEADYMKKKMKAQKSEDLHSDDEGARLCKQESADGDLPLVTTLPQERSGTVTITPSSKRVSQCKLAGTERPRSSSPRKPGNLEQFKKSQDKTGDSGKEPITVKLPRQDSKTKLKTREKSQTWDNFSAAGLPSPKSVRKNSQPKIETKRRDPPKSLQSPTSESPKKPDWIDCESLPEKKKAVKKYDSTEIKSPTEVSRSQGIRSPNGTKIVSPEECSCDCHQDSPPQTLTRASSLLSRVTGSSSAVRRTSHHSHSHSSQSSSAPTPPRRVESRGAVPKSSVSKRTSVAPPLPIRTSSAVKSPKPSSTSSGKEAARNVPTGSARVRNPNGSEKDVRRVTQESRNMRRREEAKREPLTKRTSTASSDD